MSKNNENIFSTNALHKEVSKSFVQIFRDDDDQGEKRLKSTVYEEKMEKNLNSFIERWSNVPFSPLTEATFIEIENLSKHIQKGCLSEIPPGCGTDRNEGLHRLLNRSMISGATTLSVQLAIALLTLLFYHHNQKISAENIVVIQKSSLWPQSKLMSPAVMR